MIDKHEFDPRWDKQELGWYCSVCGVLKEEHKPFDLTEPASRGSSKRNLTEKGDGMAIDDIQAAAKLRAEREQYEASKHYEGMLAQAECAQDHSNAGNAGIAVKPEPNQTNYRRPSMREEAEKHVGYHRTEADKADRAAAFFREHPEFDEFLGLIRDGVVQV